MCIRDRPNETQAVKITYFDTINADAEKAPLLNRAVSGMYPPGSTFKVITAAGILSDKPELANEKQQCVGKLVVDGFTLTDTGVHGSVDLADALRVSCNTAFAQYGLDLDVYKRQLHFVGIIGYIGYCWHYGFFILCKTCGHFQCSHPFGFELAFPRGHGVVQVVECGCG